MTSSRLAAVSCRQGRSFSGIVPRRSGTGLRRLAAAAALILTVSAEPSVRAGTAPAPPTGSGRFLDYHGPVLHAARLYLIYWGGAWANTGASGPRAEQITTAARTMLAGAYLTGLAQYRGIGSGVVRGSTVIDTSNPQTRFTDKQVREFLDKQLDAGTVPEPDPANQTLYAVVLPPEVHPGGNSNAEHNYYTRHGQRIHYLWTAMSDVLSRATWALSHEVVEAATDPEGSGFRGIADACDQDGWCEIADVCSDSAGTVLDGVTVTPYWSNQARGCVPPDSGTTGRLGTELPIGPDPAARAGDR
jgi:hypothetical protein